MADHRRPKKRGHAHPGGADPAESDDLLAAAAENWPHILHLYRQFADRHPVMLFDTHEGRVYAYPYPEFAADLSERSRASLADQYRRAVRDGKVVVFVRDNDRRRLVSFSMDPG